MRTVECTTLYGERRAVPVETLKLRPAAYAVVVNDGKALLLRMRGTEKYQLPGGGVEVGERIADTLRREVREEAGIEIEVGPPVDLYELFFIYDPSGRAYHGLHLYFVCRATTLDLAADDQVDDTAAEKPRWVEIDSLQAEDFQSNGQRMVEVFSLLRANPEARLGWSDCGEQRRES